jgi:phosphoenolpyruvate carboxylase
MTLTSLDEIVEDLFPKASSFRIELANKLTEFEEISSSNHLQSTTRNLALYISSLLQNDHSNLSELSDLVLLLKVNAFAFRAKKLKNYIGECKSQENEKIITGLFIEQTRDRDGKLVPFEIFQELVQREVFGIVITAHPTFSISKDLTHILAELVVCCDEDQTSGGYQTSVLSKKNLSELVSKVAIIPHGSPEPVTLDDEMEFALMALRNIRGALRRVYKILFSVSQKVYPNDWQRLLPKLLTVATWVGYDLDGRSDIGWSVTLKQRMIVAKLALEDYLSVLKELAVLDDVQNRLRTSIEMLGDDLKRLDCNPDNPTTVAAFSKALVESLDTRLIDFGWVIERLTQEIDQDREAAISLAVLRAEMANFGVAFAHTHVRLNANQISNAVRHETSLTSLPEDPANRRRYLRNISTLLEGVEPVKINFGSIMRERTTAKRLLMIVTQFLKFVDTSEPIRFLVAECNSAFTVLSTLYLAKLFGIEYKIDISPLFETSHALEQGHEIIAELLDNAQYVETIRRRRRLCLQTGYSDAGRYIGQISASLAIERTRIKLSKLLTERGLSEVELVIFDTHGESIGRGSHPLSFSDRLDYTYPPACRVAFRNAGIRVKQEVSFQGGDGYVYFANPDLAFSTLCRLLEHKLSKKTYEIDAQASSDPFYKDNSYSLDFFLSIKGFNERLMDNPDYAEALDLFGLNLLYSTGSRNMKRQHEGGGQIHLEHPSQLRAIPHNAILQQLGYFSNTISGLGEAITKDQDGFDEMLQKSDRFRRLISMAVYARHFSDLDRLHGYISIFDPTIWMRRLTVEGNPERVEQMQHLTTILRKGAKHEKLNRVYRIFLDDTVYLDRALDHLKAGSLLPKYVEDSSSDIGMLHGIRIALIHEIFLLISRMPRFTSSTRSAEEVVDELLHLNIKHGIDILRREFPISEPVYDPGAFGEVATYRMDTDQGYEREHRELFDPIENLYGLVCRVGSAITHFNNGVG